MAALSLYIFLKQFYFYFKTNIGEKKKDKCKNYQKLQKKKSPKKTVCQSTVHPLQGRLGSFLFSPPPHFNYYYHYYYYLYYSWFGKYIKSFFLETRIRHILENMHKNYYYYCHYYYCNYYFYYIFVLFLFIGSLNREMLKLYIVLQCASD